MIPLGLAVAPGIAIAVYIYFRDKYEKEPLSLLAAVFGYGALSVLPAAFIEIILDSWLPNPETILEFAVVNFLFIGLVEEYVKYFVLMKAVYRKPDFNEPFDGITYAVMISMGFATAENIFYVIEGGMNTAILRIFTAVPAHASFAVLMGYFAGRAKFSPDRSQVFLLLSIGTATVFHGAYDFFLTIENTGLIIMGAFVSLIVALRLSFKAMKNLSNASPFRYAEFFGVSQKGSMQDDV